MVKLKQCLAHREYPMSVCYECLGFVSTNFLKLLLLRSLMTSVVHFWTFFFVNLLQLSTVKHSVLCATFPWLTGKLSQCACLSSFSLVPSRRLSCSLSFHLLPKNKTSLLRCPEALQIQVETKLIPFPLSLFHFLLLYSLSRHIANLLNYRLRNLSFSIPSLCQCLHSGLIFFFFSPGLSISLLLTGCLATDLSHSGPFSTPSSARSL